MGSWSTDGRKKSYNNTINISLSLRMGSIHKCPNKKVQRSYTVSTR